MLQRLLRQLQHVVTALGLLIGILIGAELWLRTARPRRTPPVATQADVVDQSWLVPSATQHHQMRPLTEVTSDCHGIRFRTNSLGLRGPEPDLQADPEKLRVVLLGDDTVLGMSLKQEHTLSFQLQKHLAVHLNGTVEVVNAGVPGYSPVLSLLQYDQDLGRLHSDIVVLHFDMSDVADESIHRGRLRMDGSRAVCIHPLLLENDSSTNPLLSIARGSVLANAVCKQFLEVSDQVTDTERYAWTRTVPGNVETHIRHAMDSVSQLRDKTKQANQVLILTTSPVMWQVLTPEYNRSISLRYGITGRHPVTDDMPFQILSAWSRQSGVPLCNPVQVFRSFEAPEKLFPSDSPRLSVYGTALYARELARTILRTPTAVAGRLRTVR